MKKLITLLTLIIMIGIFAIGCAFVKRKEYHPANLIVYH